MTDTTEPTDAPDSKAEAVLIYDLAVELDRRTHDPAIRRVARDIQLIALELLAAMRSGEMGDG
jgi:hypothetical protein